MVARECMAPTRTGLRGGPEGGRQSRAGCWRRGEFRGRAQDRDASKDARAVSGNANHRGDAYPSVTGAMAFDRARDEARGRSIHARCGPYAPRGGVRAAREPVVDASSRAIRREIKPMRATS